MKKRSADYLAGYRAGYATARAGQCLSARQADGPARAARQLLEGFNRGLEGEKLLAFARKGVVP